MKKYTIVISSLFTIVGLTFFLYGIIKFNDTVIIEGLLMMILGELIDIKKKNYIK